MNTRSADASPKSTPYDWLIAIPCWGDSYREKFLTGILPSIKEALREVNGNFRFLIHTDKPEDFFNVPFPGTVDLRAQPDGACLYTAFGNAHRDALATAKKGECIAFLTSDIVISKECFVAAEKRFNEGKRGIVVTAARTLSEPKDCPAGMASRDLLEWGFHRQHEVTKGCYFGAGTNLVAWCTYFDGPNGTVARCFHIHPFACIKDRNLIFPETDTTIDLSFLETNYRKEEIHVVTNPDEMSVAEISGEEKHTIVGTTVGIGSIVSWAQHNTTDFQRWIFSHRIVVRGTGEDNLDIVPCNEIIRILG